MARTNAANDRKEAAKREREAAFEEAKVQAVHLALTAAGKAADKGATSCKVQYVTDHPLLQPSGIYAGYYEDFTFKGGIARAMRDYGFEEKSRDRVLVTKFGYKVRLGQKRGVSIQLDWSYSMRQNLKEKKGAQGLPPSESNLKLHCPVCMEDTLANVLVPCGHHVCNVCVGKMRAASGRRVECCPICKAYFHRTQLVFSDRKRNHAEI